MPALDERGVAPSEALGATRAGDHRATTGVVTDPVTDLHPGVAVRPTARLTRRP
ncbi:hypothetical protein JOD57_001735 [Geodermatophilus bullaregiensis]|nr:hypothetical protein [Geodermatophilus bullaregiensis]